MLGVNVTYTMKPGQREAFLSAIAACGAQTAIRQEQGCIAYDYFLQVDQPDVLLLVEKWTDRDAQTVHMTQPHMAQVIAIKDQCVANTTLDFYDL